MLVCWNNEKKPRLKKIKVKMGDKEIEAAVTCQLSKM